MLMHLLWSTIREFSHHLGSSLKSVVSPVALQMLSYLVQAYEHHRKHLESLPSTPYPLTSQGNAAEVPVSQRITDEGLGHR